MAEIRKTVREDDEGNIYHYETSSDMVVDEKGVPLPSIINEKAKGNDVLGVKGEWVVPGRAKAFYPVVVRGIKAFTTITQLQQEYLDIGLNHVSNYINNEIKLINKKYSLTEDFRLLLLTAPDGKTHYYIWENFFSKEIAFLLEPMNMKSEGVTKPVIISSEDMEPKIEDGEDGESFSKTFEKILDTNKFENSSFFIIHLQQNALSINDEFAIMEERCLKKRELEEHFRSIEDNMVYKCYDNVISNKDKGVSVELVPENASFPKMIDDRHLGMEVDMYLPERTKVYQITIKQNPLKLTDTLEGTPKDTYELEAGFHRLKYVWHKKWNRSVFILAEKGGDYNSGDDVTELVDLVYSYKPGKVWATERMENNIGDAVIGADGSIYAIVSDFVVKFSPLGKVVWKCEVPDTGTGLISCVLVGDTLYVVDRSGFLVAVSTSGEFLWKNKYVWRGQCVIRTRDGHLLVGTSDFNKGRIYKTTLEGKTIWSYNSEKVDYYSIVELDNGDIYCGTEANSSSGLIIKLSANGEFISKSEPFTKHGKVFVDKFGNGYTGVDYDKMQKVNSSGKRLWTAPIEDGFQTAEVDYDEECIYFGSRQGHLKRMTFGGRVEWEVKEEIHFINTILYDKNRNVYTAGYNRRIMKIAPEGKTLQSIILK